MPNISACLRHGGRLVSGTAVVVAFVVCLFTSDVALHLREVLSKIGIVSKPAKIWQTRPLLIVAAPGSGTGQMAASLKRLGLSIEHESSRGTDGTVSWFHGMRLLDGEPDTTVLCTKPAYGIDWHPMSLEPQHCADACRTGCWNECWRKTCPEVIRRQHGCHRRRASGASGARLRRSSCVPPFTVTLLQVRHPLATIASGVRGFCEHGRANATPNALLTKMRALIPALHRPPRSPHSPGGQREESCAAVLARFWLLYYSQAVEAADGWYRVESTSPCEVALAAGFSLDCDATAAPNGGVVRLASAKHNRSRSTRSSNDQRLRATNDVSASPSPLATAAAHHGERNRHNTDGFTLSYGDLERHHGGARVAAQIQSLARHFGYPN